MTAAAPKKRNNKKVEFTDAQVKQLEVLAGLGVPTHQMAAIMDVSPATLDRVIARDKKVAEAILKGAAEASATVRSTAFKMATSGKWPAMTIFWLKVRERWREPRFEDDEAPPDQPFKLAYPK